MQRRFNDPFYLFEIVRISTSGERQRRNTSFGRNPSNKSVGFSVKKGSIWVPSSVSMSFFANAALYDRRFKPLRSRRNGEQGGKSKKDGNRGNGRENDGNLFTNGERLCFNPILHGKKKGGKTESGRGTLQNQNLTGVTYLLGEGGAAASPVRRRKEGKKMNERNRAILEGTAEEGKSTATAESPAGEGRGGECERKRIRCR